MSEIATWLRSGAALAALLTLVAASPAAAQQQPNPSRPDVMDVHESDPAMAAAVARARAELPQFYRRLGSPAPDEHRFAVKFNLAGSGEMIWAGELRRENGRLSGALSNAPIHADYRQGQRVDIAESAIIDWGYVRGARMEGNHTTRVIIDRMPPEQAAEYRAALGW
ncbi:MAG: DUF2314 domain-containing protein [Sphingosinicella sp.]|uniref:DUF2314 domain-containing protein n=1 Tax=Sphingosinicella sp. TaxID=1917971 RepID=UPI004037E9FF